MRRSSTQVDKIFRRSAYAIHYRSMTRALWSVEARTDYSCLFLLDGDMSYQLADERGVLRKNDGLLVDPGKTATTSARDARFLTIALSSSYVLDCAARTGLVKSGAIVSFRTPVIKQSEKISRLVSNLVEELMATETGQEVVVNALVDQLIVQFLRHYTNARRSDELELSRAGLVDRRIRRAIELMHAHLHRDLPLEEIAAAAYLSPFHFSRLFKKLTGATPHAYLATLRALRAQDLLAETDLSITQVSAKVGYTSASHFTKAFKQATSLTPRAFRAALVISPEPTR
jgi:AraC family transcriptional regulator